MRAMRIKNPREYFMRHWPIRHRVAMNQQVKVRRMTQLLIEELKLVGKVQLPKLLDSELYITVEYEIFIYQLLKQPELLVDKPIASVASNWEEYQKLKGEEWP